jgi:hypothetical protein
MTDRGKYIATVSGKCYYPTSPDPGELDIGDIAHALSNLCRYTGHTRRFYSVAEHSVLVSHIVPPELAYVGLMHDATEAYLGDIARPVKYLLPQYAELEEKNWRVIAQRFGLPLEIPEAVHKADSGICNAEMAELIPSFKAPTYVAEFGKPNIKPAGWLPSRAKYEFLRRFHELAPSPVP